MLKILAGYRRLMYSYRYLTGKAGKLGHQKVKSGFELKKFEL